MPSARVKSERKGEAALLVRYEGKFVAVPVTVLNPNPGFAWSALPQYNYIDKLIDAKLKRLKILPSPVVDDAEFLRRVSLDLTGLAPTPEEIRAFLADKTDSRAKRSRVIDQLLARPEYVDTLDAQVGRPAAGQPALSGRQRHVGVSRVDSRFDRAEQALRQVRLRVADRARAAPTKIPPANFFRVTRSAKVSMEKTTQLFMGVRLVCTQCHDHPFEKWTQNQYYEMAAFFASVGLKPGFQSGDEIVYDKREDNEVKHPKTGRVVPPKYLVASVGAPPIREHSGPPRSAGRVADVEGKSVLRARHRQPYVELFPGPRHHRAGG